MCTKILKLVISIQVTSRFGRCIVFTVIHLLFTTQLLMEWSYLYNEVFRHFYYTPVEGFFWGEKPLLENDGVIFS